MENNEPHVREAERDEVGLCQRCKRGRLAEVKTRRFPLAVPLTIGGLDLVIFVLVLLVAATTGGLSPAGLRLFKNVIGLLTGAAAATALWKKREWKCPICDGQSPEVADAAPVTDALPVTSDGVPVVETPAVPVVVAVPTAPSSPPVAEPPAPVAARASSWLTIPRFVSAALLCLVGVVVGGAFVHIYERNQSLERERTQSNQRLEREFERRTRCKGIVDAYAKTNTNDAQQVFVDRADFSSVRNSCVASISVAFGPTWTYEAIDALTGEKLFAEWCSDRAGAYYCGQGRNIKLMQARDAAFDALLKRVEQ